MCDFVSSGPCTCHSPTGVSVDDVLVVLGGAAVVSLGYRIVGVSPEFFAVAGVSMLAVAPNWTRRLLGRGLRWLRREMWHTWTTRNQRPTPVAAPGQALAVARPWHAELVAATPAGPLALTAGTVYGTWGTPAECQADVVTKALAAYAAQGQTPPGQLHCSAAPIDPAVGR
jgi:hypothetical protein